MTDKPKAIKSVFQGFVVTGAALFSGLLANAGHAPLFWWPVTLLSFAVLACLLEGPFQRRDRKAGFVRTWWFAFGYFSLGLSWLAHAFVARGSGFEHLGWPAVLAVCAGLALFWALAGLFYVLLAPRRWTRLLFFSALFFLAEYVRGHLFTGFPWGLPGYIWPSGGFLSQPASLIGVYGLTFLAFLVSAALGFLLTKPRRTEGAIALSILVLPLSLSFLWGHIRLNKAVVQFQDEVKLRLVHIATDQKTKWTPKGRQDLFQRYLSVSLSQGFDKTDYVIWPESALPILFLEDREALTFTGQAFRDGPGLILGSVRREPTQTGQLHYYNSLLALRFKEGEAPVLEAFYDKKHLVPFGEYVPFSYLLNRLGFDILSILGEPFSGGQGPVSLKVQGLPAASPRICYEIIFPGFARPYDVDGISPEWILNISNDSWYGTKTGPQQHANQVGYRALETGLPVVRSASSGVTGLVDPYGRWVVKTPSLVEDAFVDINLPSPLRPVFYARFGDWPLLVFLSFFSVLILISRLRYKFSSSKTEV